MLTLDGYLARITSFHSGKPNFVASISAALQPLVDLQVFLKGIPGNFDLDVAIGVQLDVVGQWIGRSRAVRTPLAGLWFSFDDLLRGFDRGIWKGPYDTGIAVTNLDDDTYRRLLRAKILANSWDGTTPGAQAILNTFYIDPATLIFVEDDGSGIAANVWFSFDDAPRGFDLGAWLPRDPAAAALLPVDMKMTIGVSGKIPSLLYLTLLSQDALPIHASGVAVTYAVTSVNFAPVFGFDVNNTYVGGFDTGSWPVSPAYLAVNGASPPSGGRLDFSIPNNTALIAAVAA